MCVDNFYCTLKFDMRHTQRVEKWIDELDSKVHPLKNFVIPVFCMC